MTARNSSDRFAAQRGSLKDSYPLYLAGKAVVTQVQLEVIDKYTGQCATKVSMANEEIISASHCRLRGSF